MYIPSQFLEERTDILLEMVGKIQLACLVTSSSDQLIITHLPMLIKETPSGLELQGHIARKNTHWELGNNRISTAIFQGPHAYISPTWYESKKLHGNVVPTWNYAVVHIKGELKYVDDFDWLFSHLKDLTEKNESNRDPTWSIADLPLDFTKKLAGSIVGIYLQISEITGVWKMIQHKSSVDRWGAINGLEGEQPPSSANSVAEIMKSLERKNT